MRKLNDTELFKLHVKDSQKMEITKSLNQDLNQNRGDIAPHHIEPEIAQLKIKTKSGYNPFLKEAIGLYENFNGRIRLFNLGVSSKGMSPIPGWMPFLVGLARDRTKMGEPVIQSAQSPTVFVNMYRIGNWSLDESTYDGLNYLDLRHSLIIGNIMHKILLDQQGTKLFSNTVFLENLTRIYTYLFKEAVKRTASIFGGDFNDDAANYLIAKFFLRYVMLKDDNSTTDDIAYKTVKRASLQSLINFEDSVIIDYSSLSKFLETLGETFFSNPISLARFEINWVSLYGEGMNFAVEYVPYLLHYLIAAQHNAFLGGATKLYRRLKDLQKEGLIKLYQTIVTVLS